MRVCVKCMCFMCVTCVCVFDRHACVCVSYTGEVDHIGVDYIRIVRLDHD